MLHVLGAACCAGAASWIGFRGAAALRDRARTLRNLEAGLTRLEQELELEAPPMPDLMDRLQRECRGAAGQLFSGCRAALDCLEDESLSLAWDRLLLEIPELDADAADCLRPLGGVLGRCSWEEQQQSVCAVRDRMSGLAQRAEEEGQRQGKVCRVLGLSGGAFLMILLL